jgi:hypothetical protein
MVNLDIKDAGLLTNPGTNDTLLVCDTNGNLKRVRLSQLPTTPIPLANSQWQSLAIDSSGNFVKMSNSMTSWTSRVYTTESNNDNSILFLTSDTDPQGLGVTKRVSLKTLFDTYKLAKVETGTWTPVVDAAGRSAVFTDCIYQLIGNLCILYANVTVAAASESDLNILMVSGFPYAPYDIGAVQGTVYLGSGTLVESLSSSVSLSMASSVDSKTQILSTAFNTNSFSASFTFMYPVEL